MMSASCGKYSSPRHLPEWVGTVSTTHSQKSSYTLTRPHPAVPAASNNYQVQHSSSGSPARGTGTMRSPVHTRERLLSCTPGPQLLGESKNLSLSKRRIGKGILKRTFMFSACRSPGVPWKSRRYGGYSASRACANAMACSSGIWQSSSVNRRVVTDSCQIRLLICIEEEDTSRRGENMSTPRRVQISEGSRRGIVGKTY